MNWSPDVRAFVGTVLGRRDAPISTLALSVLLVVTVDALAVSQVVFDPEHPVVQLVEVVVPLFLTLGFYHGLVHVARSDRPARLERRVLGATALLAAIALGTVTIIAATQHLEGRPFTDYQFTVTMVLASALAVGAPAGIYYHEAVETRERLVNETERTRRLNQRLEVLLRVLRHNVRNEINVALGTVDDVRERTDDDDVRAQIVACEASLRDLHAHAEKSLRVQRLTGDVDPVAVDLVRAVRNTADDLPDGTDRVTTDLPATLPVEAHPMIEFAVAETVENALSHCDTPDVTVTGRVDHDRGVVHLSVADSGSGLPEVERAALDLDAETPLHHGSGVGLWLVRWIVEESEGRLRFEENDPEGLVVRFELPLATDRDA